MALKPVPPVCLNLMGMSEARLSRGSRSCWRIGYWLLTGALIGFGMIAILSIGSLFLLLGVMLLVVGALRVGPRGIWAALGIRRASGGHPDLGCGERAVGLSGRRGTAERQLFLLR